MVLERAVLYVAHAIRGAFKKTAGPAAAMTLKSATKLWILTVNYAPEPTGFAPHATALAEYLARRGFKVSVITGFPFSPQWKRWPEYRWMLTCQTTVNKVAVRRVSHFIPRHAKAMSQRLAMEATFCVAATAVLSVRLLRSRDRPDALLYIGAQPGIAMLARAIAKIARTPYLVNINDLAVQAAADVGIVRTGWMRQLLQRIEFSAYLSSAGATVLCRSFAQELASKGYPASQTRIIRSPVDIENVRPVPFRREYREHLGIPDGSFVVLSAGSMGLKQGLANVIEAARRSVANAARPILWVLVGDGETRPDLERLIAKYDLGPRVRLVPFQPEQELSAMFAAADVLLLNQVASVKDTVVPSKLLTYMAAGRPVLAAVNAASQGAEILLEADGGLLVKPEDPDALLAGVHSLMQMDTQDLQAMGARNRLYAEGNFDQKRILAEHESFILEALAQWRDQHAAASA